MTDSPATTVTEDRVIAAIIQARRDGKKPDEVARELGRSPAELRRMWNHAEVLNPIRESIAAAALDLRRELTERGMKAVRVLDAAMDVHDEAEVAAANVRISAATKVLDRVGVGPQAPSATTNVVVKATQTLIAAGPEALRRLDAAAVEALDADAEACYGSTRR